MPLHQNPLQFDLARELAACQAGSRRNGKVARLPCAVREQINQMIDDGVPYKTIIEKLGPAGQHLNESNLSHWRSGGYQDHRKAELIKERARIQTDAAADLVRQNGTVDPAKLRNTCSQLAALQYLETLAEHGEELARDSFKKNPAKLITLINALSSMSNANIAIQKQKWRAAEAERPCEPSTNPQSNQQNDPVQPIETP